MAAKTRVNITVDRETLRLADREARRRKTSRSEFIRAAVRAVGDQERRCGARSKQLRQRAALKADRGHSNGIAKKARETGRQQKSVHDWRYQCSREMG